MKLSFYTPIAYDYEYSYKTIQSYYDIADEIILAIDKDRISWSGKKYDLDNSFYDKIIQIDSCKKIKVIEENFHHSSKPLENETNERNFILSKCTGDFVIGIDSDEVLLNSTEFLKWFKSTKIECDISCTLKTVFKQIDKKLLVCLPYESTVIGTARGNKYLKCRITGNKTIISPLEILHHSWGRTEQDVLQKLQNWGHSKDFNISNYFNVWKSVSLHNYEEKRFLHPLGLKQWWQRLELISF